MKNHGNAQVTATVAASAWTRGTADFTTGASSTTATLFAYRPTSTAAAPPRAVRPRVSSG